MEEIEKNYITDEIYFTDEGKKNMLVYEPDGRFKYLTSTEYEILMCLFMSPGKKASTDTIGERLWGIDYDYSPDRIKSPISRLRKKMNSLQIGLGDIIETVSRAKKETGGEGTYRLLVSSKSKSQNTDITSATYDELIESGYTSKKIAESLIKNDEKLYGKTAVETGALSDDDIFSPQNAGKAEQWSEFLASWPESFEFIINNNKEIVGNYSFLSLDDEQYNKFLKGEISESDFNPYLTRSLNDCDDNHIMFLLNLSVNEEYSTTKNNILIRRLFWGKVAKYGQSQVLFKKIVVNVFRPAHETYFKSLGFKFLHKHPLGGKIYEIDLIPYPATLYEKFNSSQHYITINDDLIEAYGTRYLQLSEDTPVTDYQLRDISCLVYDTDEYIYPCLLGNKADAATVLTSIIKKNTDSMFRKENLFVAVMGKRVIGLILYHKGPLKFCNNELVKAFKENEILIPDGFERVCSDYLESYNAGDNNTVHIINVCIKKEYRRNGLGREMLRQFFDRHSSETMELYVLEENTIATKLYEELGFKTVLRENGFSRDNRELPCLKMKR